MTYPFYRPFRNLRGWSHKLPRPTSIASWRTVSPSISSLAGNSQAFSVGKRHKLHIAPPCCECGNSRCCLILSRYGGTDSGRIRIGLQSFRTSLVFGPGRALRLTLPKKLKRGQPLGSHSQASIHWAPDSEQQSACRGRTVQGRLLVRPCGCHLSGCLAMRMFIELSSANLKRSDHLYIYSYNLVLLLFLFFYIYIYIHIYILNTVYMMYLYIYLFVYLFFCWFYLLLQHTDLFIWLYVYILRSWHNPQLVIITRRSQVVLISRDILAPTYNWGGSTEWSSLLFSWKSMIFL